MGVNNMNLDITQADLDSYSTSNKFWFYLLLVAGAVILYFTLKS